MSRLNKNNILIILNFLFIIPKCLTQDLSPVIITDESGLIEKTDFGNPFARIDADSFRNIILNISQRYNDDLTLIFFIDDYLTVEDLSSKDSMGSPFPYFNRHLRKNTLIYLPSVENPYNALIKVCPNTTYNTHVVTKENGEIQIARNNDKHLYIIFGDSMKESRLQRLRRHGKILQQFVTAYKDFTGRNIIALYTGRQGLGSRRNDEIKSYPVTSKGTLVHGPGGIYNLKSYYSEPGQRKWKLMNQQSRLVDEPRITHQMEYIVFDDIVLGMNFTFTDKTWTLLTMGIMESPSSEVWLDQVTVLATVGLNNSYHCATPYTFVSRRDQVTKFHLKEYQIQPFKVPETPTRKQLKDNSEEVVSSTPQNLPKSTQPLRPYFNPISDELKVAQSASDVEFTSDSSPRNAETGTMKFNIQKYWNRWKGKSTTEPEKLVSLSIQKHSQSTPKGKSTTETEKLVSLSIQKHSQSTPKSKSTTKPEKLVSLSIQKHSQSTPKVKSTTKPERLVSLSIQKHSQSTPKGESTRESKKSSFNIPKGLSSTFKTAFTSPKVATHTASHITNKINFITKEWLISNAWKPEGGSEESGVIDLDNIKSHEKPQTKFQEKLPTESQEKPQTESQEKPQPKSQERPQLESQEKPQPESQEKPHPESQEKPQPESHDKPQPGSQEKPHPESQEKPHPESQEKPHPESQDKPQPESQERPQTESQERPQTESQEKPQPESQEKPQPESQEKPETGSQEGTETESHLRRQQHESESKEKSLSLDLEISKDEQSAPKRFRSKRSTDGNLREAEEVFDEGTDPKNKSTDLNDEDFVKFSSFKYINPSALEMAAKDESEIVNESYMTQKSEEKDEKSAEKSDEKSDESTPSAPEDYITIVYQSTTHEDDDDDEDEAPTHSTHNRKSASMAQTRREGGEWLVTRSSEASNDFTKTPKVELRVLSKRFGNAAGCVVYFTAPILSGLMASSILLMILFFGIVMIMDLQTYDRFDDPQGTLLNVPIEE